MEATTAAMPALVAIVLSQGCQPLRIRPTGQAMLHEKTDRPGRCEHNDRVPVHAVAKAAPSGARQVFLYGERVDVAHPAAIEIADVGVVRGVGAAPKVIWRERQHPDHASDQSLRHDDEKRPHDHNRAGS